MCLRRLPADEAQGAKIALVRVCKWVREVCPRRGRDKRARPSANFTSAKFTPFAGANPDNLTTSVLEIRCLPPAETFRRDSTTIDDDPKMKGCWVRFIR